MVNGITSLIVTKLDVFDTQREIQVCVGYCYKGGPIHEMPAAVEDFAHVRPEYRTLPGWQASTEGTAMEALFSESYAGIFRNPKAKPEAAHEIYGAHLYPVFSEGRCRLNITGLPADAAESSKHVAFFAKYCY